MSPVEAFEASSGLSVTKLDLVLALLVIFPTFVLIIMAMISAYKKVTRSEDGVGRFFATVIKSFVLLSLIVTFIIHGR